MPDPLLRPAGKFKEEWKMNSNLWYLTDDNNTDSSYTDFTYTDFTAAGTVTPVQYSGVRKAACTSAPAGHKGIRKASLRKAKVKTGKKRSAGKIILCIIGVIAIAITSVLVNDDVVAACSKLMNEEMFTDTVENDKAGHINQKHSEPAFQITAERTSYDQTSPAYEIAEDLLATLRCDNDVDTAWEIFNWVHSNIYYQIMTSSMTFEEAAFRGFTRKTGDCYVYFACAKMLLDCAGIPNLMIERYPVINNSHYWNLVQLNGEWYHCDATVFRDHTDMFFMCTDEEINDGHHSFDESLYPERASWNTDFQGVWGPGAGSGFWIDPYTGYDNYYDDYEEYYDGYEDYDDYDIYGDYDDGIYDGYYG